MLSSGIRYKIPEYLRDKIIKQAEDIIDDPEIDTRIRNEAIRLVLQMDKINIDLLKLVMPKKIEHTNINPSKLTDEELREKLLEIQKLLPRVIDGERSSP